MLGNPSSRRPRLHLKVLDAPQRRLWSELGQTPDQFTLYGGTALALRLGHRRSVDFDFFSTAKFDPIDLLDRVPYLHGADVRQNEEGTLSVLVHRGGPVKVSFFAPPRPPVAIGQSYDVRKPRLRIASLIDIAATKLAVLPARPAAKDYLDIHALIIRAKIDLATQLAAFPAVYPGASFNPHTVLKALCYFGDGDLDELPSNVKRELTQAVASTSFEQIEVIRKRSAKERLFWKRLP